MFRNRISSLFSTAAVAFVLSGCGENIQEEPVASEEHKQAYDALHGSGDADIELSQAGEIVAVTINVTPTDAHLQALSGLQSLTALAFSEGVSDTAIPHLKGLSGLKSLNLGSGCTASRGALEELSEALPNCVITSGGELVGRRPGED